MSAKTRLLVWLAFLLSHALALIGSKKLTISPNTPEQIESFAFQTGGTFSLSITVFLPHNFTTAETLLLLVQRGADCDQIGKHCTFSLLKSRDWCESYTISDVFDRAIGRFPVLVPFEGLYPKNESMTELEIDVTNWLQGGYVPEAYSVKSFITDFVTPAAGFRTKPFANGTLKGNESKSMSAITSNATGEIKGTDHVAFIVLSCSNVSLEYPCFFFFPFCGTQKGTKK